MPRHIKPDLKPRSGRSMHGDYARVYLEDFHLGDKSKIGRFYWLGLGAFAAKQVAVTLEDPRVLKHTALYEGLGRGNLWLYNDVLPWFYGYAAGTNTFDKCAQSRDCENFVGQVKTNLTRQKGYAESIDKVPYEIDGESGVKKAKLGYLKCTSIVTDGFKKVTEWEGAPETKKPDKALKHLIAIAQHEQGEVLQGLIHDNPPFAWWLNQQRAALASSDDTAINDSIRAAQYGLSDGSDIALAPAIRALVPNLQLVLTSDDKTNDQEFLSVAKDRIVMQDYQQRMGWIQDVAKKYHKLMREKQKVMLDFLTEIRYWGDLPDPS